MATQTPNNEMISSRKRSRLSETFSPIANRGLSAKPIETTTSKYLKHNNNEKISINSNNIHKIDDLNVNPIDVNRIGLVDVTKIFNDHVHGNIKLDGLCLHIIDTPEFQRLHNLKQNGSTDFVYRGATHTRFEHSIGVAHLAERFVKTLHANQPNLNITATDILCVKVAGLCHDLGHGPFSHVFDGVFLKRMYPHGIDCNSKKWRHEDGSIMMFRHLLAKNGIHLPTYGLTNFCDVENQPTLETKNSLNTLKRSLSATSALRVSNHSMIDSLENSNIHIQYDDQLFIEEIIGGVPEAKRKGRNPSKFFLYDIVNNIRSGLDVDKLDYFQRDMKMANIFPMPVVTFDRFVELAIVLPAEPIESKPTPVNNTNVSSNGMLSQKNHHPSFYDKQHSVADSGSETEEDEDTQQEMNEPFNISKYPLMICYPEKMISEALNLFAARFHMHKEVYTHKATKQVEFMVSYISV